MRISRLSIAAMIILSFFFTVQGCADIAERTINRMTDGALDKALDKGFDSAEKVANQRMGPDGKSISYGDAGEENAKIREVQEALIARGYNPGRPDGVMGPKTRAALKAFQQDCGLLATGELNEATCQRLALQSSSTR